MLQGRQKNIHKVNETVYDGSSRPTVFVFGVVVVINACINACNRS